MNYWIDFKDYTFKFFKEVLLFLFKILEILRFKIFGNFNFINVVILILIITPLFYIPDNFFFIPASEKQKWIIDIVIPVSAFIGVILTLEVALYSLLIQRLSEVLPPSFFDKFIKLLNQPICFILLAFLCFATFLLSIFNTCQLHYIPVMKGVILSFVFSLYLIHELFKNASQMMSFESPRKFYRKYLLDLINYYKFKSSVLCSFLKINPRSKELHEHFPKIEAYGYVKHELENNFSIALNELFDLHDKFYAQNFRQLSMAILETINELILEYISLREKTTVLSSLRFSNRIVQSHPDSNNLLQPYFRRLINIAYSYFYVKDQDSFCKLLQSLHVLAEKSTNLIYFDLESNKICDINLVFEAIRDITCNKFISITINDIEFYKFTINSIAFLGTLAVKHSYKISKLNIVTNSLEPIKQNAIKNGDVDLWLFVLERMIALSLIAYENDRDFYNDLYNHIKHSVFEDLKNIDKHICLGIIARIFSLFEGHALSSLKDFYTSDAVNIAAKEYKYFEALSDLYDKTLEDFVLNISDDYEERIFEIYIPLIRLNRILINIGVKHPTLADLTRLINKFNHNLNQITNLIENSLIKISFNKLIQYHLFLTTLTYNSTLSLIEDSATGFVDNAISIISKLIQLSPTDQDRWTCLKELVYINLIAIKLDKKTIFQKISLFLKNYISTFPNEFNSLIDDIENAVNQNIINSQNILNNQNTAVLTLKTIDVNSINTLRSLLI